MEVKGLLFDAYGTLFNVHSVVEAGRAITTDPQALSDLWRAKQLEYTWLRTLMGHYVDFWDVTEAALGFACRRLRLDASPAQRATLMESYLRLDLFPEVRGALGQLSGLPCAILSNGAPRMLEAVVAHADLGSSLAAVISVDTVRKFKPAPEVYALGPARLGLPKERLGFVSSNCWDVVGAKAFGFQVIWVNRARVPLEELGFAPDLEIGDLTALTHALGRSG